MFIVLRHGCGQKLCRQWQRQKPVYWRMSKLGPSWYYFWHCIGLFYSFTDDICLYFGVKIAMYFAWLGMYTKWLVAPAVLGIVTFILSSRSEATRDWCILFFNIFNIVWATLFLEAWKRKSAELAYKWGTMDMPSDVLKEPRPLFRVSNGEGVH